jgi:hypothetical protein
MNSHIGKANALGNRGFLIAAGRQGGQELGSGRKMDKSKADNKVKQLFHIGDI